jgi:hypothetical protein
MPNRFALTLGVPENKKNKHIKMTNSSEALVSRNEVTIVRKERTGESIDGWKG